MTRLHDATEGTIRVQDEPIQNFLLDDLRKATSVLFQDFANFPFSVRVQAYFSLSLSLSLYLVQSPIL